MDVIFFLWHPGVVIDPGDGERGVWWMLKLLVGEVGID